MDKTQEYWKNIRNIEDSYLESTFYTWDYPLRKNTKEKILDLIKNSDLKGKKIHLLEIGCGTGPNIWNLKDVKEIDKILGIDFDTKAIDFCSDKFKNYDKISFLHLDIVEPNIPLEEYFFDIVLVDGVCSTMNPSTFKIFLSSIGKIKFNYLVLNENQGFGSDQVGDISYYRHDFKSIQNLLLIDFEELGGKIKIKNHEFFFIFKKIDER